MPDALSAALTASWTALLVLSASARPLRTA